MLKGETIYDVLEDDFDADDDIAVFDATEDDIEDILHALQCDAVKSRETVH